MTPRALLRARDTLELHGYEPYRLRALAGVKAVHLLGVGSRVLAVHVGRPGRVVRNELVRLAERTGWLPLVVDAGKWWRLTGKRPAEREPWTWEDAT